MKANSTRSFSEYPDGLIENCRKGDHKAMLQLYKMYYKPVFQSCLRLVNDPKAAEDIMQESFLAAFENISCYKGNISFIEWLLTTIKY